MDTDDWIDIPPEKLREALGKKLGNAYVALMTLRVIEPNPPFGGLQSPEDEIVRFLSAARSVYLRIQTYAKVRKLPFAKWRNDWEHGPMRTEADRKLWARLRRQRNIDDHGAGPELIAVQCEMSALAFQSRLGPGSSIMHNASTGVPPPTQYRSEFRFATYPDESASIICERMLTLTQSFADAFLNDPAMFPPGA
jgi:hypothetical protein